MMPSNAKARSTSTTAIRWLTDVWLVTAVSCPCESVLVGVAAHATLRRIRHRRNLRITDASPPRIRTLLRYGGRPGPRHHVRGGCRVSRIEWARVHPGA